jgi:hypothetical protein
MSLPKCFYATEEKECGNMSGIGLREGQILQLERNLDKIHKLRSEILNLADEAANVLILRKKIAEVLLLLGSIANCANPRNEELDTFIRRANLRFVGTEIESSPWPAIEHEIELFCDYINSIAFDFARRGVRIFTRNAKQVR